MKQFMDENFLLNNESAITLYHTYAKNCPIFDYHCHINVNEICEDKKYENLTQVWLYGDHYKWRAMRLFGIEEKYITGDADDYEKFLAYAKVVSVAVGNPLYHWTHLELQRYFDIYEPLNEKTAPAIWEKAKQILQNGLTTRQMIVKSNVKALCSTDDPADDLRYHKELLEKNDFEVKVLPTFRPDKTIELNADDFVDYMSNLSAVAEIKIVDAQTFKAAMSQRLDYFQSVGCKVSDHGVAYIPYVQCSEEEADSILKRALNGEKVSATEDEMFKTWAMIFFAKEYFNRGMMMQLHMGALRRVNSNMNKILGADTGFDSINDHNVAEKLGMYLDKVNDNGMPRTVLYCLNPKENPVLATMLGNFADGGIAGKMQFGSAWWFNDTRDGMVEQMKVLGNLGLLAKFVGMLTDSRSFTSYPRFEYFRRILCNIIGTWMEEGEIANDVELMGKMIEDICFNNIANYLELEY